MEHEDFMKYEEKRKHGTYLLPFVIYGTFIPEGLTYFPVHWHDEMEIVVVKEGHCTYYVDFQFYEVYKGDILIIPPAYLHSFRQYEDEHFESRVIVFSMDMINNSKPDICSKKYFMPIWNHEILLPIHIGGQQKEFEEVGVITNRLIDTYYGKQEGYELRLKMYLMQFFNIFFENQWFSRNQNRLAGERTVENTKSVIEYIEQNYHRKITLEQLATYTHQSVYNLAHTFKKSTGRSPIEYINHYRLVKAAKMLEETDSSILNIAIENGFNNVSYFNRAFKSCFGITPSEYRKDKG